MQTSGSKAVFRRPHRDQNEEQAIKRAAEQQPLARQKTVRLFKASPIVEYSSLLKLLVSPINSAVVRPKAYFQASNELIVYTLIICWLITLIFTPETAVDHPARRYVGHFNPCFGWDFAPASYVAVFSCAADVHLAWTYATLEASRTRLRDNDGTTTWAERFSLYTTYLHGLAAMVWMLLWQVGPPDGRWVVHLALFTTAVGFRYLCTLGNYVEGRFGRAYEQGLVTRAQTVFICIYGAVTLALPLLYFYDVLVYEIEGRAGVDPPLPWYVLQAADVVWMVCLALSTRLAVPEPPLRITRTVLEFDDHFEAAEHEGTDGHVELEPLPGDRT